MFHNILVKYEKCLFKTVEFEYNELMLIEDPDQDIMNQMIPQFKFAEKYQIGGNIFHLDSFKKENKKYRLEFKIDNKIPYD